MPGPTHQVANPPSKTRPAGLRWRLRILQTLDRALARNHCRRSRLRGTAGRRCAFPGSAARRIRECGQADRNRRTRLQWSGSGLPLVRQGWRQRFWALGFRACSGFRFNFKLRLRLHCPASHAGAYSNLALLGQRCPASHLFPSASLVFALPRPDLSDRVSLALGTGGRVDRRPGSGAGASIA